MPIYEYRCLKCGTHFEILCKAAEKQSTPICPECNSSCTKGIIAGFGVHGVNQMFVNKGCSGCKGGKCSTCC